MSYSNRYTDGPIDGLDGNNSGMYDAPIAAPYTPSGNYYDLYMISRFRCRQCRLVDETNRSLKHFVILIL